MVVRVWDGAQGEQVQAGGGAIVFAVKLPSSHLALHEAAPLCSFRCRSEVDRAPKAVRQVVKQTGSALVASGCSHYAGGGRRNS